MTFKPTFWPTLGTIIVFPILIALGIWQWQRAEYKAALLAHYNNQSGKTTLTLEQALKDPEGLRYFTLRVRGQYLNEHQFLQDNQFHQHQVGYYVLTPFVTDSKRVILVNRGWVHKAIPQQQLQLSSQVVSLVGRVSVMPSRTFYLGENVLNPTIWPRLIQVIKGPELSAALGHQLEPVILLLDPGEPNGFVRDWQPTGLPPEKHRGYALQWFAFATLLVVLFLVLNIKRRGHHANTQA